MQRVKMLLKKSKDTLKSCGFKVFIRKSINYIKKSKDVERNLDADKVYADVLFINGSFLPHPSRYRVSHQMEQLKANNISCQQIFFEDLKKDLVKNYRVFIFFRCIINDEISNFIELAKKHNKTVIYDIDDLVIDTKYTDEINYIKRLTQEDRENYSKDVKLMGQTLSKCDLAITSTDALAKELENYVEEVFINRNTASEEMVALSEKVVKERNLDKNTDKSVKIGYFSGSITHNDDFNMILPTIVRLMKKYKFLKLHLVGEIDLPNELQIFKDRIVTLPFVNWRDLPKLIGDVDINLVPLEDTLFNTAKSENKWIEASLVKVVTVASKVGALEKMIQHGNTGFLCSSEKEWNEVLEKLIKDKEYREQIASNAYKYVYKNCTTIYTGFRLAQFIEKKMTPNIVFILPSVQISGGIRVVLEHCLMMKKKGIDVLLINEGFEEKNIIFKDQELLCISKYSVEVMAKIDKCVATLWSTTDFLKSYERIQERYYLVQGFETEFNKPGEPFRIKANATYNLLDSTKYITISKWCKDWLKESYGKEARYAPNGIDSVKFKKVEREFSKEKVRILIEGNSEDSIKNVDESFKIVNQLDKNKFEIWYMSYKGEAKNWYRVDKSLYKIPYDQVGEIYGMCDILLKSSILESFSYPPLEMMATGGLVVVVPNEGNREYLIDEGNCLFYEQGNIENAIKQIERLCTDKELRQKLIYNGFKTVEQRDWNVLNESVLKLYNVQ